MATNVPSLAYMSLVVLSQNDPIQWADLKKKIIQLPEELSEMLTVRRALGEMIVEIVNDYNGYVFGGYPRDMLTGKSHHDIDCKFKHEHDAYQFVESFRNRTLGRTVNLGRRKIHVEFILQHSVVVPTRVPRFHGEYAARKLTFACVTEPYTDVRTNVDVSIAHRKYEPDFDVNQLQITKNGHFPKLIKKHRGIEIAYDFDVSEVCASIQQKQFRLLSVSHKMVDEYFEGERMWTGSTTCSNVSHNCVNRESMRGRKLLLRIKKMEARGWTLMTDECECPWCILSTETNWTAYQAKVAKEKEQRRIEHQRALIEKSRSREQKRLVSEERARECELRQKYWTPWSDLKKDTRGRDARTKTQKRKIQLKFR